MLRMTRKNRPLILVFAGGIMIFPTDYAHTVAPTSGVHKVQSVEYHTKSWSHPQYLRWYYQVRAAETDDWFYYKKLLELNKHKNSKFAQILEQERQKI